MDSSIHFSNTSYLGEKLIEFFAMKPEAKLFLIDFSGVNDIDAPSFNALEEMIIQLKKEKEISVYCEGIKRVYPRYSRYSRVDKEV